VAPERKIVRIILGIKDDSRFMIVESKIENTSKK
jgi:hypothetical protein